MEKRDIIIEQYLSDLLTGSPEQKRKHILHLDLHFREETDGFFFDCIDDEKFAYHMVVQSIQGWLTKKDM
jgi:hypothetical protein